jgi:HK97 family phage portal protein
MWTPSLPRIFKRKTATAVQRMFDGIPLHRFSDYESYLAAASLKVWASWKACDICANAVSNTRHTIRRGIDPVTTVPKDLAKLLSAPNQFQTWRELIYLTVMHLKATGNAYWFKSQANLAGDKPVELYPINPKRLMISINPLTYQPSGYLYTGHLGTRVAFDLEEIMHFKRPHPNNDFYGLGDIEAGEPIFNENINRDTWTAGFWKNGASPSGVMTCKAQVDSDQEWERVKAMWRKEYSGADNAGKTALLTGDWAYTQLGLTAQEMQNIEGSKWNAEQIFMQHGVPLSVAGIRDAANFATADIDNQRFREYTIQPIVMLLQDTINTDLVQGWGPDLNLFFNITGLINIGKIAQDIMFAFQCGMLSINDGREMLGLPRDEENELWNQHFVTAALVPLEQAGVSANGGPTDQAAQAMVRDFVQKQFNDTQKHPELNGAGRH